MSAIHGSNLSTDNIVCCLDPSNKGYRKTPFHIQDHSGNGNDGYLAGGSFTTEYYANTGQNDGLVFDLDSPNIWTISMLIKRPTGLARGGSYSRIAGTNGVIDRGEIALGPSSNTVWVNSPKGGWMSLSVGSTSIDIIPGETAYLCVTFDRTTNASNIIGYKNGVKVVVTSASGSDEGGMSGYTIGSRSDFNGEYLPMEVYHVTVHTKELSDEEVAQNFEALRRRVNL